MELGDAKSPTSGREFVASNVDSEDTEDPRDSGGKGLGILLPKLSINFPEGDSGDSGHVGSEGGSENTDEARLDAVLA